MVFAVRAKRPGGKYDDKVVAEVSKAVVEYFDKLKQEDFRDHNRGNFDCINFGMSYGGGQGVRISSPNLYGCYHRLTSDLGAHDV